MKSTNAQKILTILLFISLCFIVACGKTGTSSSATQPSEGGEGVVGSAACYSGEKSDNTACAKIKTINGANEGYLNPYTDPSFMASGNKDQYRRPVQAVDLVATSPNLKVAPSFAIKEFMSLEKGNFGIFSTTIVKVIQKLRDKTGAALRINSAFRSPKYNSGIEGSAKWSRHQYGDGVDIASTKVSLDELVKLCTELGATYVDKYVSHVHCDWRNTAVEPVFFGNLEKSMQRSESEERINILQDLMDSSEIHISGKIKKGNIVLLSSSVQYKEDNEELYKRWVIFKPNGDKVDIEQSEVSLPLETGTYQVIHYIGNNIKLNKSFFVN